LLDSSVDLDTHLAALAERIRTTLAADAVLILLALTNGQSLTMRAQAVSEGSQDLASAGGRITDWHRDRGIVGWVVRTGQSTLVPNTAIDPRARTRTPAAAQSVIAAPLLVRGQAIGVLRVSALGAGRFQPSDLRLVEALALATGIVIENARLSAEARGHIQALEDRSRELEERSRELEARSQALETLAELGTLVLESVDSQAVAETVIDRALPLGPFDVGMTNLLQGNRLELVAARGLRDRDDTAVYMDSGGAGSRRGVARVLATQEPLVVDDVQSFDGLGMFKREGVRSGILVPIRAGADVLGLLALGSRSLRQIAPSTVQLVTAMGSQVGLAIQKAWLHEETDRARTELEASNRALTEATQAKSAFLATMSHEIRTPMNGVIGMTGLLLDTPLSSQQREFAEATRASGEALLTIINEILDFSKIEAGRLDIELIPFDLRQVVVDVIRLLADSAHSKSVELTYLMDDDVPTAVRGDPGRIRQVLTNLLGNAVKFTNDGSVAIRVSVADVSDDMTTVRFEVADTGIGIPEEARSRLFQPFSQVDSSTTRRYGGTGLGLAISRQLAELMGGMIGVESQVGQGSTFWFTVQLEREAQQPSAPVAQSAPARVVPPDRQVPRGLRLLVAEDNVVNQRVAIHMLAKLGYQADVVADGNEAVEALARIPYPLVLMDCQMPELDGYAATATIRGREADRRHTLIIAMTAGAMTGDRERCLAAGMDDYIAKPVREAELAAALARWLPDATGVSEPDVAPAAGDEGRVNRAVLGKIGDPAQGGDPAFLGELITIFREETLPLVQAMRAAAQTDAAGLIRPTHTLRGSAGYLGATRLTALCEQLEALGRSGTRHGAAALVDQLEQEVADVLQMLEQEAQRWAA